MLTATTTAPGTAPYLPSTTPAPTTILTTTPPPPLPPPPSPTHHRSSITTQPRTHMNDMSTTQSTINSHHHQHHHYLHHHHQQQQQQSNNTTNVPTHNPLHPHHQRSNQTQTQPQTQGWCREEGMITEPSSADLLLLLLHTTGRPNGSGTEGGTSSWSFQWGIMRDEFVAFDKHSRVCVLV